jgi:hypothetical protein
MFSKIDEDYVMREKQSDGRKYHLLIVSFGLKENELQARIGGGGLT